MYQTDFVPFSIDNFRQIFTGKLDLSTNFNLTVQPVALTLKDGFDDLFTSARNIWRKVEQGFDLRT